MGRYTGKNCRLLSMFSLTSSFFLVEIVVGHFTGSMALIADSFHMLSDIAALIIAFISVKMAPKPWDQNTYGWARAEVLGALVNAVFMVFLCISITVDSLKRFVEPPEIDKPVLILEVGAVGLVVNLLGLCLFHEHGGHGHSHGHTKDRTSHLDISAIENTGSSKGEQLDQGNLTSITTHQQSSSHEHSRSNAKSQSGQNMNMRGVFLHVMADALGSVIVIISAVIMWQVPGWKYTKYVDPALSLIMVMLMTVSVWPLLIESARILLQTAPTHIHIDSLKSKLLESIDGILSVHEFHVWQLSGDRIIASAHIRCLNVSEYMKIAENVKEFFHNKGIHSTTIQLEYVEPNGQEDHRNVERNNLGSGYGISTTNESNINEDDCVLGCPRAPDMEAPSCQKSKCCLTTKEENKKAGILEIAGGGSKSAQSTPTNSWNRQNSFVLTIGGLGEENGELQLSLISS